MDDDRPVLDTLAAMTAASMAYTNQSGREFVLARLAALAAVGAPAVSYLAHVGPATDVGVTIEDVQGVLTTIAPIIGSPRTVTAALNIRRALGFVILVLEAELEAEMAEMDGMEDNGA
jgi:alkylhydroperoxidase/carboxymuconolactone decarboxylase family protein YurZ